MERIFGEFGRGRQNWNEKQEGRKGINTGKETGWFGREQSNGEKRNRNFGGKNKEKLSV